MGRKILSRVLPALHMWHLAFCALPGPARGGHCCLSMQTAIGNAQRKPCVTFLCCAEPHQLFFVCDSRFILFFVLCVLLALHIGIKDLVRIQVR
jgi:hypothetical protein